ncbi:MAG: sugar phosphate nucleotidyltransferase, partial [Coprobacillus sp.]
MKAVILAGGKGSRIWPYNYCRHKTNIPIGNKPIIRHQIEALRKTGIEEILIVGDVFTQELKHD